jgi:hypothetical protein
VVANEQNNNYIEFGEKVFGERCSEANPSAKIRLLQQLTPWVEACSMAFLQRIDDRRCAADTGGKLQFLQSYRADRFAIDCLTRAGNAAAGSPRPATISFFNPSASDRWPWLMHF